MAYSSVQQDPRAPADHWHCTPTFGPVEGALTSCPVQDLTAVVSSLSNFPPLLDVYRHPAFLMR